MSWFRDFFRPRRDNFMRYLIEQTALDVRGMEALVAYMSQPSETHAEGVNAAEKEADEVRRMLVDELNRTFVTPLDREDIYTLSRTVDDLLDYAHSTVEEMQILKITPCDNLKQMAEVLLEAAKELHLALMRLEEHPSVANDHSRKAKAAENRMEKVYRRAIADLFNGPADPPNIVSMLKRREVYRHLSNAADRADQAANIISDIVVKMS